mgnify:CR=1 FL=1
MSERPRCQYADRAHPWWPCRGALRPATDGLGGAMEVWRCEQHQGEHEFKLEVLAMVEAKQQDREYYDGIRAEAQRIREAREDREYYDRIRAEAAQIKLERRAATSGIRTAPEARGPARLPSRPGSRR